MKRSGLRNRFPDWVRLVWIDWYSCFVCNMNQWEVLHHIMSPSNRFYVDGEHNESVFNSCPVHNYTHPSGDYMRKQGGKGFGITDSCHIGNDGYLHSEEVTKKLLNEIAETLLFEMYYVPKPVDIDFVRHYAHLYSQRVLKKMAIV